MLLQTKIKNIILMKLYFRKFYITRKLELQGSLVDKESGSGIFPDSGDPKRPDPQHWNLLFGGP